MEITIKKTKKAEYSETENQTKKLAVNAIYGVFRGQKQIATILRGSVGWRVCKPTKRSRLGLAISPLDLNNFWAVRDWVKIHFGVKKN